MPQPAYTRSPTRFNPRTRRGCDDHDFQYAIGKNKFQSTHPQGVRLLLLFPPLRSFTCFNPRTRRGCDHVPRQLHHVLGRVSIHAPAGGATLVAWADYIPERRFQSTHPQGVRRDSISPDMLILLCFNPRTRRGCDSGGMRAFATEIKFQSTHPQGVRLRLGLLGQ